MNGRAVTWVLLVLVVLATAGLWWRTQRMREAEAAYRAERLTGRPVEEPLPPEVEQAAEAAQEAQAAKPPEIPATLSTPVLGGKVLRVSDESPLEGAIVEVLGAPRPDGQPAVLCHGNTVPDGSFVFTAPDLAATALRIWCAVPYHPEQPPPAGHPGYRLGECIVQTVPLSPEDARRLDLTIKVDTGWVLWGTVSDTKGQALIGGSVTISEPYAFSTVDPHGQYRIRDLPPSGQPLSLMASGMRVRGATVEMPPPAADQHVVRFDIQLEPAGLIFGKVGWKRGTPRPVMPPVVTVVTPGATTGPVVLRPATVDAVGNYQIDGLSGGNWDLSCAWSAIEGNTQRTYTVYARGVAVEPGATVQHDFLMPGDAALDLQVTGPDGKPRGGLTIELGHVLDASGAALSEVFGVTDADGRCAFTDLAAGTKEVRVMTRPEAQPGAAPTMPERLATQRVELADGPNSATVVVTEAR